MWVVGVLPPGAEAELAALEQLLGALVALVLSNDAAVQATPDLVAKAPLAGAAVGVQTPAAQGHLNVEVVPGKQETKVIKTVRRLGVGHVSRVIDVAFTPH